MTACVAPGRRLVAALLVAVAPMVGGLDEARGEASSGTRVDRQVPAAGGVVDAGEGLLVDVAPAEGGRGADRRLVLDRGTPLGTRDIHPGFQPFGPHLEVGPDTRLAAMLSIADDAMERRDGARRVLAVEIVRHHRLGPFDPTASMRVGPVAGAGDAGEHPVRETAVWVMAPLEPREGGRIGARAALIEGRRLQLGWVPDRLAPPAAGVPVGVGGSDASLCVSRRGAVFELSSGERLSVAPTHHDPRLGRDCDEVTLRRVRKAWAPRLRRGAFTAVGPTFAVEGLIPASLLQHGRASLSVPVPGGRRRGSRFVLAVERVVNNGECSGRSVGVGCEVRWQQEGQLIVEARLDDEGRAHARLPVDAQVGLRDGRLRFGWLSSRAEGVEVLPVPRYEAR